MFALLTILMLAALAGPLLGYGRRGLVPVVVGELIAGAVLGRTGFHVVDATTQPLPSFSAIGFAMLMFTAGTQVDIGSPMIRSGAPRGLSALLVVAGVALPLALLVDHSLSVGNFPLLAVLITGSSAAIAFPIITERGLRGPSISFLIPWIAVADSITVLLMPLTLTGGSDVALAIAGDAALVAAAVIVLLASERLRRTTASVNMRDWSLRRGWAWQVRLSVVLVLGLSAIAERTGASSLIAGFLAGMVLVRLREPGRLVLQLTGIAEGFFVPLFFVLLGAQINLRALVSEPSRILLALALVAAAFLAHVIAGLVRAQVNRFATGMAATAQLGLPAAAASLGLSTGRLTAGIGAALVAGGCLTLIPATIGTLQLADAEPTGAASPAVSS